MLKDSAVNWARFGETCLGQALYRHRTVFQNASEAPAWSHLELSYFRSMVPGDAILDLVVKRQPATMDLLRAEILPDDPLVLRPAARLAGLGRSSRNGRHHWSSSRWNLAFFGEYRDVMRDYCWPCRREACPGGQVRNVQGDGDGGGALS